MIKLRYATSAVLVVSMLVLAGCGTSGRSRPGGYYKDDGPGTKLPADLSNIPDAVPRIETHARGNSKPYVVFGLRYVPISDQRPFHQKGVASWYGKKFHGAKTANGETYDMYSMSAAHPTLPIPSYARVTRIKTGKSVIVRINDRGPFHSERIIDLSYVAAAKLGIIGTGSDQVVVQAITNNDIRQASAQNTAITIAQAAPAPSSRAPSAHPGPTPDALAAISTSDISDAGAPAHDTNSSRPYSVGNTHMAFYQANQPTGANSARPDDNSALSAYSSVSIPPMATAGDDQIYLQFGAFSAAQNASHLVQKLNHEIAHLESRPAQVRPTGDLYRVQIGPYPSRTAAVNAAVRIQQETGVAPTIAVR